MKSVRVLLLLLGIAGYLIWVAAPPPPNGAVTKPNAPYDEGANLVFGRLRRSAAGALICPGMTRDQVEAILGLPNNRNIHGGYARFVWSNYGIGVVFHNSKAAEVERFPLDEELAAGWSEGGKPR